MAKKSSQPAIGKDMNISVRQIQNGFIVRKSGYTGNGKNQKYVETEVYSKSNPVKIDAPIKFGKK